MRLHWTGLAGSSDMVAVVQMAKQVEQLCVVITREPARSDRWRDGIAFFTDNDGSDLENLRFPDWETLPYDAFSPHQDIISERLSTLQTLRNATHGVLTVPVSTLMQKVPPVSYLDGACFDLACGQTFDVASQRLMLEAAGYQSVETVTERGQYAVRGALMDIYPMGAALPVRVDLLDDEIDTLRTFDPDSQRTVERINGLSLLPAKEFPFDDDAVGAFRDRWHDAFQVDVRQCSVYQDVSSYIVPNGVEYYMPLFFGELASLFDYLPEETLYLTEDGIAESAQAFEREIKTRYESLRHDVERPILPPSQLYLGCDELNQQLQLKRRVVLGGDYAKHQLDSAATSYPICTLTPRLTFPLRLCSNLSPHSPNRFYSSLNLPGAERSLTSYCVKVKSKPSMWTALQNMPRPGQPASASDPSKKAWYSQTSLWFAKVRCWAPSHQPNGGRMANGS
jgi:transcription-repair coupling factor (superfamily II helicase)